MPRYKPYSYDQAKLLPVSFAKHILPGTFEYTLNHLIDHEIDLSRFDARYRNDEAGAPAYDPAILLKIILYAYSRGVISSRQIERLCRENVVMMALCADTQPHCTTVADFVASMDQDVRGIFRDVLLYCEALGLIGRDMFAIDGLKLSSNASKEHSGTKAQLQKKQAQLEQAIRVMLKAHRECDAKEATSEVVDSEQQYIATLKREIRRIKGHRKTHGENVSEAGTIRQGNRTDPERAKMKTSHGVLQGYDACAAVDNKHQIIVHAQAFGEGQEHGLLKPMVEGVRENITSPRGKDVFNKTRLTADAGFHTEKNMQFLDEQGIDAYVADRYFRKRDPRFNDVERYQARTKAKRRKKQGTTLLFTPDDFTYDAQKQTCICPAGKRLYHNGSNVVINGYVGNKFRAPKSACTGCELRAKCLKHPERSATCQVVFFRGRAKGTPETLTEKMKRKIDSVLGRHIYNRAPRHRRTRLCESPLESKTRPLHPAKSTPGRYPVEALQHRAQHREDPPVRGRLRVKETRTKSGDRSDIALLGSEADFGARARVRRPIFLQPR